MSASALTSTTIARPPTSAATSIARGSLSATTIPAAPSRAKRCDSARPMTFAPPVITTTRPLSSIAAGFYAPGRVFAFLILLRLELERDAVHAVALPGRMRTIRKHVAEMPAAFGAMDLDACHAVASIGVGADRPVERCAKARPTGAALELGSRVEQRLPATRTEERSFALLSVQGAAAAHLGAMLTKHLVLLRCQLGFPLFIVLGCLGGHEK